MHAQSMSDQMNPSHVNMPTTVTIIILEEPVILENPYPWRVQCHPIIQQQDAVSVAAQRLQTLGRHGDSVFCQLGPDGSERSRLSYGYGGPV